MPSGKYSLDESLLYMRELIAFTMISLIDPEFCKFTSGDIAERRPLFIEAYFKAYAEIVNSAWVSVRALLHSSIRL